MAQVSVTGRLQNILFLDLVTYMCYLKKKRE
jgi:hypothetical protein